MDESSPRFGLPFLVPGQAQKELFHNEALARIDVALGAAVLEAVNTPPESPAEGRCWIVAAPALAAWSGREDQIAFWTTGGWRFIAPADGMEVWNLADGVPWRWINGAWASGSLHGSELFIGGQKVVGQRATAVPSPSGGTIIDAEARLAINQIIVALMSHGLID
jgi:hypothetical protein